MELREYWRIKQRLYLENTKVRARENERKRMRYAAHADEINARRREARKS